MLVHADCRYFKGDMPCKPHKDNGVHCDACRFYTKTKERILIIKLGAIGDVIRTTPLLTKLRQEYPQAEISWLTYYPEVVPSDVDRVFRYDLKDILSLLATDFDIVYNLDKDREVCSLATMLNAGVKKGFCLSEGKCSPIDESARHKWLTGLFDDVSRHNTKSYPQEIFEICGFTFSGEEYILRDIDDTAFKDLKKKETLIGLNTGCGGRWNTRLWPEEFWVALARKLAGRSVEVLLLGGPDEDEKNRRIAEASGCMYLGHFPIETFVALMGKCDLIVTGVTMALHIAIGLKKRIVLLNNIFNKNEFELYNLGTVIEPEVDCLCCYRTSCETDCMRLITPEAVAEACENLLAAGKRA